MKQMGLGGEVIYKHLFHHKSPNTHLMYIWLQVKDCKHMWQYSKHTGFWTSHHYE